MDRLNEKQIQILRQKLCDMHNRCENKSNPSYVDYGARGIKVCEEWSGKDKHNIFRKWAVDNGWREFLSIDRIDVNGDYSPLNCRWANPREQANNRRNNNYIEINGVTKTASEWASEVGISFQAFKCRIKYGKVGLELLEKPKTPLKLSKSEMSKEIRKWRNLEENGLLKVLPCKVGDTLYLLDHECTEGMKYNCEIDGIMEGYLCRTCGTYPCTLRPSVQEVVVDSIKIIKDNTMVVELVDLRDVMIEDFGKSVFLTREEAQNKLKEME